jgi:hypothetical protein
MMIGVNQKNKNIKYVDQGLNKKPDDNDIQNQIRLRTDEFEDSLGFFATFSPG